ncbi:hypothetical protein ABEB36_011046 [Hypothenemus hampei]|uniref:Uncharacterized protein n=1 Tax=Hypothenemus hampei TaxID=57062 RepID=A0ABD1EE16_HYPHA
MSESDLENYSRKRRKSVRNTEEYKATKIKKSRLSGEPYKNYPGNMVPGKATGVPCMCKLECFKKVNEADTIAIMKRFRSFKTKNEQNLYFQGLMISTAIKQRRPRKDEAVQRTSSFKYFILINAERRQICKKAFLSLHGISSKAVQRLQVLLQLDKAPKDLRGQQNNRKIVAANIKSVEKMTMFSEFVLITCRIFHCHRSLFKTYFIYANCPYFPSAFII